MTDTAIELQAVQVGYLRMWVRRGSGWDIDIAQEVQQAYYWDTLTDIAPDHVVDIGGHIGTFTLNAKRVLPFARYTIVEPHHGNFRVMEANVGSIPNVAMIYGWCDGGVSDEKPRVLVNDNPINTGGWKVIESDSAEFYPLPQRIRLADLMIPGVECGALKLDCEGSEIAILGDVIRSSRLREYFGVIVGERHTSEALFREAVGDKLAAYYDIVYDDSVVPELGTFIAVRKDL